MSSSTPAELQARYMALSTRIAALDRDIALETDNERRTTMQERRDTLADEREGCAADLTLAGIAPQTDATVEHRVTVLEHDMRRLWDILRPRPRQTVAKVICYTLAGMLAIAWLRPESSTWLIDNPVQAIALTLAVLLFVVLVWWLPREDADHDKR